VVHQHLLGPCLLPHHALHLSGRRQLGSGPTMKVEADAVVGETKEDTEEVVEEVAEVGVVAEAEGRTALTAVVKGDMGLTPHVG